MSSLNTDELIALVRKRPQLWDRGNRLHSNRHILDKCWKKIASELQADENKIRKKWKYLRDQFSVEFGKIPPAGCKDEAYEPKWRYYKPLQFLEEVVTPRINTKNPRREDDSSDSEGSSISDSPPAVDNRLKPHYTHRTMNTKQHKSRYPREKQNSKCPSDSVNEEHLHFFKSLLPHVRNIPPHLQLSFRNRVQEVVEEFAYRSDLTATANSDKSSFPPHEPYFITCVPDHTAKFEPPEIIDESRDNQDDDGSS